MGCLGYYCFFICYYCLAVRTLRRSGSYEAKRSFRNDSRLHYVGARPRSRVFRVESSNHAWHSLVLASRIRRPRSEGPWTFQLLCERYWHRWHRCAGSQAAFLLIVEDDILQVRCDCLSKLACPTWWRSPSFTLIFRLVVVPEIWCLKSSLLGHCLV